MAALEWNDWDETHLRQASEEQRTILLFLVANWCRYSQEMQRTTFADERVIDYVTTHHVPIRVDADRRPDLDSRYNMGGWPTIAVLTPEGDLIAGENFLSADELLEFLPKVDEYYERNSEEIAKGIPVEWRDERQEESEQQELARRIVDDVVSSILEKFDHRFGGWGEKQKFPHTESLDFAMVQFAKTDDHRMKDVVTRTLDHMIEGGIHDPIGGGFFRFSTTPDWRIPHYEKVLDNNALRLRALIEAYQLFEKPAYRRAAEGICQWLTETMLDPETGAFFGSQGDEPSYYALSVEDRARRAPPNLDRTIYTNWNAMTIGSLLKASVVLGKPELRDVALKALDFLMGKLYFEKEGMYHYWDGTYHLPGLLSDQAYTIQALVHAAQFTGDSDLLLPAEALAEQLLETHRAPEGGFFDVPQQMRNAGALNKRNRSILENSVLAEALLRLSYLSRREEFADIAHETLLSFTGSYKQYGYFVAGYARAVDLVLYEPIVVTVVGNREEEDARALRHAAQRSFVASRIVQALDPQFDPILLRRSGYEPSGKARAYLSVGRRTLGHYEDAAELEERMREVELERRKKGRSETISDVQRPRPRSERRIRQSRRAREGIQGVPRRDGPPDLWPHGRSSEPRTSHLR
jgi:uncharacterized protein YyaL (SSP411 family)